jgi:hypothetical protein
MCFKKRFLRKIVSPSSFYSMYDIPVFLDTWTFKLLQEFSSLFAEKTGDDAS